MKNNILHTAKLFPFKPNTSEIIAMINTGLQ
ncbi:hypothetical protein J2W55_003932 [Mucilaginibacter pocheonensis]|uniref:Uncharacterized protein n=1 Tax=Mucilaginibacter pocheonensis TaxID=398050 RepID=A0ABU1TFD8_9SPHI|nr:hypothetical protein [Mucilaginibacter pocheonensis]